MHTTPNIIKKQSPPPLCNYIDGVGHNDGELVFTISDSIKSKVTKTIAIPNSEILRQEFLANISTDNRLASGKEILIVKSIVDDYDFMIIENFRFNDENEKKIKFIDNKGILDLNNIENSWDVIRRFATVEGMINYIQKYPEFNGEKTIFLGAHPDIGYVEEQLYSIYYSQYLTQLLNSNPDQMQCLHCGEKITDNENYLIEFDEYGYSTAVGNVHNNCLRPIDRILGKNIYKDIVQDHYLKNFDFDKWIQLLQDGQGQLAFLKKHKNLPDINIISWNPENQLNNGSYCIKILFDNGDTNYVMVGKQIQRFTEKEIDSWIQKFTDALISKPCKIIQSGVNGYISTIENIIEEGQTISYVLSYEKVRYSKLLEKTETTIIYSMDAEGIHRIFSISGCENNFGVLRNTFVEIQTVFCRHFDVQKYQINRKFIKILLGITLLIKYFFYGQIFNFLSIIFNNSKGKNFVVQGNLIIFC